MAVTCPLSQRAASIDRVMPTADAWTQLAKAVAAASAASIGCSTRAAMPPFRLSAGFFRCQSSAHDIGSAAKVRRRSMVAAWLGTARL
jgi:TPP-dependent indolepyruvate ferredoxin oxidoreductase alpha subunit